MATSNSKWIPTSMTVIGIILALAETVTGLGAEPLNALLGVEWGGKVIIVAGLVLAFIGRLKASKALTWLPVLLCVAMVGVGGCAPGAGQAAREGLLSPWVQEAWPTVEALAERGIADMVDDGELTDQTAAFPTETVRLFGEAVGQLGGE